MPPMRVERLSRIEALLRSKGWMREVRFVYISPDGVDTISIDVDEDEDLQMVVVEFILD